MRRLSPRIVAASTALALAAGGGAWAWISGAAAETWAGVTHGIGMFTAQTSASAGLRLHQVTVEGRERTSASDLLAAIDLPQGGPLMAFDPQAARERIESLQWVKEAVVERRLPHTIHVRLVERLPIAILQDSDNKYRLIDADGALIEDDISRFAHLPLITGPGAAEAASDLFTILAGEPEIAPRVKAAVRVGQRRWNIWLDEAGEDGVEVRLPETDAEQALARLAELERKSRILRRHLAMIDLRLPDRMVVQVSKDAEGGIDGGGGTAATLKSKGPLPLTGPAQDA